MSGLDVASSGILRVRESHDARIADRDHSACSRAVRLFACAYRAVVASNDAALVALSFECVRGVVRVALSLGTD
jgi:hypothetical protein